jgi:TonB family protein
MNNHERSAVINYGASELKAFQPYATFRGFLITLLMLLIISMLVFTAKKQIEIISEPAITEPTTIEVKKYKVNLPDIVQNRNFSSGQTIPESGTKKVAGKFVVNNDISKTVGIDDIATVDNIGIVSSKLGDADNIVETLPKSDIKNEIIIENEIIKQEDEIFTFVEKEPVVDLIKLQQAILYPAIARKAGVQGKVLVNVLVGIDGNVLKTTIEESDNLLLNESAIQAVLKPGIFSPAIQDNRPVKCWIMIPINFKLK